MWEGQAGQHLRLLKPGTGGRWHAAGNATQMWPCGAATGRGGGGGPGLAPGGPELLHRKRRPGLCYG